MNHSSKCALWICEMHPGSQTRLYTVQWKVSKEHSVALTLSEMNQGLEMWEVLFFLNKKNTDSRGMALGDKSK